VLNVDVDLAANLKRARDEIAEAAIRAGRQPAEITLVGISKTQPVEMLAERAISGRPSHQDEIVWNTRSS